MRYFKASYTDSDGDIRTIFAKQNDSNASILLVDEYGNHIEDTDVKTFKSKNDARENLLSMENICDAEEFNQALRNKKG